MHTTCRIAAVLALLLVQHPTPEPAGPAEPPLRYRLMVGAQEFVLEEGRDCTPVPGGPTYRLDLLPTRSMRFPGAFAFEYPREFEFGGAASAAGGWWTFSGRSTLIHLQRHSEDAAAVVERYVQNSVAAGATDVREARIALGGRELAGRAFDLHLGGFHGWGAEAVQEVYGFESGSERWLLMIQKTLEPPEGSGGAPLVLELDGRELPFRPGPAESTETLHALELLRASFRFEG